MLVSVFLWGHKNSSLFSNQSPGIHQTWETPTVPLLAASSPYSMVCPLNPPDWAAL